MNKEAPNPAGEGRLKRGVTGEHATGEHSGEQQLSDESHFIHFSYVQPAVTTENPSILKTAVRETYRGGVLRARAALAGNGLPALTPLSR